MKRGFAFAALGLTPVILVLVSAVIMSSSTNPQAVVSPDTNRTQNLSASPLPASSPEPAAQPAQEQTASNPKPAQEQAPSNNSQDFKSFLPPENEKLRNFILSDSFLSAFLQDVWIGDDITEEQLLQRGFYINKLYKHKGNGLEPVGESKGACSFIGFRGAFMCGRGMMAPHQWGIQSDEAIRRLNILEEEWGALQDQFSETSSISNQSSHQSPAQSRVVQAGDGYANLRSQPSTEVKTTAKIPNGTSVEILAEQTNTSGQLWYKVQVDGQVGWIYSGLLN